MLIAHVERYILLRQTLGFKLREVSRILRAFAKFAVDKGDTHIRTATATDWAAMAPTPDARHIRLRNIVNLARFLHAEDPLHEVPFNPYHTPKLRSLPYIYAPNEIVQIMEATNYLRESYPLHRQVYATLIGLIAATGLRISEALDLRFHDLLPDGVLQIRRSKFGKSRLIPLHPTAVEALDSYLIARRRLPVTDDHVFLSKKNLGLPYRTALDTFRCLCRIAGIAAARTRPPRIHDLRHTFATRALEQCSMKRDEVARHFVALATYLGHVDIKYTYWYLEATPELMTDIAAAAEALVAKEGI